MTDTKKTEHATFLVFGPTARIVRAGLTGAGVLHERTAARRFCGSGPDLFINEDRSGHLPCLPLIARNPDDRDAIFTLRWHWATV